MVPLLLDNDNIKRNWNKKVIYLFNFGSQNFKNHYMRSKIKVDKCDVLNVSRAGGQNSKTFGEKISSNGHSVYKLWDF